MSLDDVLRVGVEALTIACLISLPAILVALVVGLVISVLQAATQVQEQTLALVPKLVAIYLVLAITARWALDMLSEFAARTFAAIAGVG